MNIAFYLNKCGMGNNGGTRTVVKSCETLNHMGHNAVMVSTVDRYTWDWHPAPVVEIPKNTDIVVACSPIDAVAVSAMACKKVWWVNSWSDNNAMLFAARSIPCIANSHWLSAMLKRNGVNAPCCHAGMDKWRDLRLRGDRKTVGFLYNTKHKSKWKYIPELIKKFPDYDFLGFGNGPKPDFKCRYIRMPKHKQKEEIYSQCHIWVAPTESEGFHNVGAEAGVSGCLIMCNRLDCNGMSYATETTADRFSSYQELIKNVRSPTYSKVRLMQTYIRDNIGTRKRCMGRFVRVLREYSL